MIRLHFFFLRLVCVAAACNLFFFRFVRYAPKEMKHLHLRCIEAILSCTDISSRVLHWSACKIEVRRIKKSTIWLALSFKYPKQMRVKRCWVPREIGKASSVRHLDFRVCNYVLGHLASGAGC